MTPPRIFCRENRVLWAGICLLALGQAVAMIAGVVGTRLAFAKLDEGGMSHAALVLIAGAALGLAGARFTLRLLGERLGQSYTAAVRKALLAQAMATRPERIAARRRGYLMLRLTGDMATLKDGLARSAPPILQAATLIPAALAALFWVNPGFGAATLIVLGLSLALIAVSSVRLRHAHQTLRKERAKLAADMAERLPIAPELARLGRRRRELSRLGKATIRLGSKAQKRLIWVEVLRASPGVLTGFLAVFILHAGVSRGLAAGDLAAALAALGLLGYTLSDLADALDRLLGWQVARAKLAGALRAEEPAPLAEIGRVRLGGQKRFVRLELASDIARPESLNLAPGGHASLRARDPARLLQCLTGRAFDQRVQVLLDDIPLSRLTAGTLRRSIGVIDSAPVLLKGSVRRNLCLGLSDRPTDASLQERIEKAGLSGLLCHFGGLDGPVSEAGRSMTVTDRIRFATLQSAVQRPGLIVLAARPEELPVETTAYLEKTRSVVLHLVADPQDQTA